MFAKRGFDTIFSTFGLTAPEGYSYVSTFYGHIYLNISEILSVASQVPFIDASTLAKIGGVKSIDDYITMIEPISARFRISFDILSSANPGSALRTSSKPLNKYDSSDSSLAA